MLWHISILQLSVRLEEYKLNKVKNISPLPCIYRLSLDYKLSQGLRGDEEH